MSTYNTGLLRALSMLMQPTAPETQMLPLLNRIRQCYESSVALPANLLGILTLIEYKKILAYVYHYIQDNKLYLPLPSDQVQLNQHIPKNNVCPRTCEIVWFNGKYQLFVLPNGRSSVDEKRASRKIANNVDIACRLDAVQHAMAVKKISTIDYLSAWDTYFNQSKYINYGTLDHPYVLQKYMGCFFRSQSTNQTTAYKATIYSNLYQMTLERWLATYPKTTIDVRIKIFEQVVTGLYALHAQNLTVYPKAQQLTNLLMEQSPWDSIPLVRWAKYTEVNPRMRRGDLFDQQCLDTQAMYALGVKIIYNLSVNQYESLPDSYKIETFKEFQKPLLNQGPISKQILEGLKADTQKLQGRGIKNLFP